MPNDAKLGMIVGVGLVVTIAVVFFRKDAATSQAAPEAPALAATTVPPTNTLPPALDRGMARTVKAQTAIRREPLTAQGQRHTVTAGETLFTLAQRYYQDEKKFVEIYRANQEMLKTPDPLPPGTVLIIPTLP